MDKSAIACKWGRRMQAQSVCGKIGCHREEGPKSWGAEIAVCVCACVCVRARVHMRVCAGARMCGHMLACVCTCLCVCAHVCTHARVHVRVCAGARMCGYMLACVCTCVCVCMCAHVCVCLWVMERDRN